MPTEVLATPLLCENAKQRCGEAQYEADRPQGVHDERIDRSTESDSSWKGFGSRAEEGFGVRGRTVLKCDEGEELDSELRVVWLEKHDGHDQKRCEYGGEQTRLFIIRFQREDRFKERNENVQTRGEYSCHRRISLLYFRRVSSDDLR